MLTGWYTTRLFSGSYRTSTLPRQREVLAERMADEAVVGEDAAQVRVAAEQDAEQVERLALEPVGARPDVDHGIDRPAPACPDTSHASAGAGYA